jgi:anti-anti-sigma factor
MATVGELEAALREAESSDAVKIVVDLAAVTLLDSAGLRCLVRADNSAREAGRALVIRPGTPRIRAVFESTGLDSRLSLSP